MNKSKNQAIGIFDSGVGGLTVMREIVDRLPSENVIYFGDTARVPYGEKSPETIIKYSIENTIFLLEQNIKVLVVACNTASAYAIDKLKQLFNIPILGVIEPGALKAVSMTKNQRIAVLGTKGTIKSNVYETEIKKHLKNAFVLSISCPLLVPLVEENLGHHLITKMILKEYLAPIKEQNIDTVLLGCTHYPLLKELIQEELGDKIAIVDSASICAETLAEILKSHDLESNHKESICRYFVSDDPEKFKMLGSKLFDDQMSDVLLSFGK